MKTFYKKLHTVIQYSRSCCYTYYDTQHDYPEMYKGVRSIVGGLSSVRQKQILLYSDKSFETYCALFGILLSENIWVPANPSHPIETSKSMLNLMDAYMIISDRPLPEELQFIAQRKNIIVRDLHEMLNEDQAHEIDLGEFPQDELAYIMFTSGSTGVPKGVPMTHVNYINFIENMLSILPFEKNEVFSDFHDLGFDISIFYLFCCVLTESAFAPVLTDGERFFPLDNIIKNKVTVWSSVPSAIARIKTLRPEDKVETNIKIMFLCGEPFRLDILEYCYENMDLPHVYNFYGLTETGVENFHHTCTREDLTRYESNGYVPIGRPLPGNDIDVTDENELLIAGCQITPGYLGGIGKERFETIDGTLWFHSGDIVEKYKDVYFCKGRLDTQVKISGYRVELMGVEVNVRKHPLIREAVCFVDEENNAKKLVCGIYLKEDGNVCEDEIIALLQDNLPHYMIPKEYFKLADLPLNKNGKIDRVAIRKIYKEQTVDMVK